MGTVRDKRLLRPGVSCMGHLELIKKLKPRKIEQLAAVLAIKHIRPAKRHLQDDDWQTIPSKFG